MFTPAEIDEANAAPLTPALADALLAQFMDPANGDHLHEILVDAVTEDGEPATDALVRAAFTADWERVHTILRDVVAAATPYLKAKAFAGLVEEHTQERLQCASF